MKPTLRRRTTVTWLSFNRDSGWPASVISPSLGPSSPPNRCSSVDLPEPEGPMMATNSPLFTTRFTPSRAFTNTSPIL